MIGWHQADLLNRMYIPLKDGNKAPMARYYKDRIYEKDQLEEIQYHIKKLGDEQLEEELELYGDDFNQVKRNQFIASLLKMFKNAESRQMC